MDIAPECYAETGLALSGHGRPRDACRAVSAILMVHSKIGDLIGYARRFIVGLEGLCITAIDVLLYTPPLILNIVSKSTSVVDICIVGRGTYFLHVTPTDYVGCSHGWDSAQVWKRSRSGYNAILRNLMQRRHTLDRDGINSTRCDKLYYTQRHVIV